MKEEMYGYYISYEYSLGSFSFDIFSRSVNNVFGYAIINYDKPLEEFLSSDYEAIKQGIIDSLNKDIQNKEIQNEYKKENIIIINIIPKKYEVLKNEENN